MQFGWTRFFYNIFFCEIARINLFSLTNAKGESCIGNEILSPNTGQFIDINQLNLLILSLNFILLLMLHKDSAGARCADTAEKKLVLLQDLGDDLHI